MRSILLAAMLCTTTAALATELPVSVSKRPVGEGGDMWIVTMTSHDDALDVRGVDFNRGGCKSYFRNVTGFPHPMHFGQQVTFGMTGCDPIEMKIQTDQGTETIGMME